MAGGLIIDRHWVRVLENGSVVLEWGDGTVQDIYSGAFMSVDTESISVPIEDRLLEVLKRGGIISSYNQREIVFNQLPSKNR